MAPVALTDHTDQTLQTNSDCKYMLADGTDSIPSHNRKHEQNPGCKMKQVRDDQVVRIGTLSGKDNCTIPVAGQCKSQSMTDKSSETLPIANTSDLERVALSEDVKLTTEYASDDTSGPSNDQMFAGSLTSAEAAPNYTGNGTGNTSEQITSQNQKPVNTSTIQIKSSNCYMQQEARFKSFYNLPFAKVCIGINQLSESGFYYDDKAKEISCVICGYVVQETQTFIQLKEDHLRKSPKCSEFVNTSKKYVGTDCCEKHHQEGIPETDGESIHFDCSGSDSSHQSKTSVTSVLTDKNCKPKKSDAEYLPVIKFSGKLAQEGSFQRTPRSSKTSALKARTRTKTKAARHPNTSALRYIGNKQLKDGISQSHQNQHPSNGIVESNELRNSYKRCLEDELYLQKKRQKARYIRPSESCVSKKDLDAILEELVHPNACLTDNSMKVILTLIGLQFPQYYIPCDMNKFFVENGVQALDTSLEFGQVIFVPPPCTERNKGIGHFILLTNIGCRKVFQVCDSLGKRSMKLRDRSHQLIRKCLGFEKAPIVVVKEKAVSGQIGDIYCGLYVIACLIDICLGNGKRINSVVYNQERMRSHLIETIERLFQNRPIQEFPVVPIDRNDQQSTFTLISQNIAQ